MKKVKIPASIQRKIDDVVNKHLIVQSAIPEHDGIPLNLSQANFDNLNQCEDKLREAKAALEKARKAHNEKHPAARITPTDIRTAIEEKLQSQKTR